MATLSISGNVIINAGANIGSVPPTAWDGYIEKAEGVVEAASRYKYRDNGPAISGNAIIAQQTVEDLAAIRGIRYDMSSIASASTLIEAEDRITVLRDSALRGLSLLRDQKVVKFITT